MFRRKEKRKNKSGSAPSDSLVWLIAVSGMMIVLTLLLWILPGLGWYPALVLVDTLPPLLLALVALMIPVLWLLTLYLLLKQRWNRWVRLGLAMLLFAATMAAMWMPIERYSKEFNTASTSFAAPLDSTKHSGFRYNLVEDLTPNTYNSQFLSVLRADNILLYRCDTLHLHCDLFYVFYTQADSSNFSLEARHEELHILYDGEVTDTVPIDATD